MVDSRSTWARLLRGILGNVSGTAGPVTFAKSGTSHKKTLLNKFPGQKKEYRITFKCNPHGKIIVKILITWNCQTAKSIVLEHCPDAVFISCHIT